MIGGFLVDYLLVRKHQEYARMQQILDQGEEIVNDHLDLNEHDELTEELVQAHVDTVPSNQVSDSALTRAITGETRVVHYDHGRTSYYGPNHILGANGRAYSTLVGVMSGPSRQLGLNPAAPQPNVLSNTNIVNGVEVSSARLICENSRQVPAKLLKRYINRVLLETRLKVGPVVNDALHRRIIHRTANNICLQHNLRVEQRMIVTQFVVSFYFVEDSVSQHTREFDYAYNRYKHSFYYRVRKWFLGRGKPQGPLSVEE